MPERVRAIVVRVGDDSEPDAALAAAVEIARGSGRPKKDAVGTMLVSVKDTRCTALPK